jgi:parvulin-like peptidyl-prolyl isomerase
VQAQIQQEVDKILTGLVIERETAQWKALFNALPNTDQTAREAWITHPEKYTTPPQYRLTVILFATPQHSVAEARHMADDARAKILAGADMATLAREQSDDPAAKGNGGQIDWTPSEGAEQPFANAVSRLAKAGDLSPPIKTAAGYQLVRLDSKKPGRQLPFDEVKPKIIEQLRAAYVEANLAEQLRGIRTDPTIVVNQPAVDALVVHVDPEYMRKLTQEAAERGGMGEKKRGGRNKIPVQMGNGTPAAATPDLTAPPAPDASITGK